MVGDFHVGGLRFLNSNDWWNFMDVDCVDVLAQGDCMLVSKILLVMVACHGIYKHKLN